jgi:hypothetical protein
MYLEARKRTLRAGNGRSTGRTTAGGAAYHKGIHKKTSDLVGDSPQFFSVTAEESAAQAWRTACAFALDALEKFFGGADR